MWRWAGPIRRAGSPRLDDFYHTFIWSLLSKFNQEVYYGAGKRSSSFYDKQWRKTIMQNKCSYIIWLTYEKQNKAD